MATPAQRTNTWILDEWYDQAVAGTTGGYQFGNELWAWGDNAQGTLGQNSPTPSDLSSPTQIGTNVNWSYIDERGNGTACFGVKTDGTLWAWGSDDQGSLGQNSDGPKFSSPMQIGSETNWSTVDAGRASIGAITTSGELFTWGWNNYGILGHNQGGVSNAAPRKSSPVQVPGTNWKQLKFGFNHVMAVKTDGTLWGWGNNDSGRLGFNNNTYQSSPTQIGTDTTWDRADAGITCSLASKTDGTLWSMGTNTSGELGLNSNTIERSSPTQIPGTWAQFSCNTGESDPRFNMGVKTNGNLYIWGRGYQGQMGLGGPTTGNWIRRSSPTQLPGTWDTVKSAGGQNTINASNAVCAKKADDTWWVWGFGGNGGLGLNQGGPGPTTSKASPVQLPGTYDFMQIGGSGSHAMKSS